MMKIKATILAVFLGTVLISCNNQQKKEQNTTDKAEEIIPDYSLIGKKGIIAFPEMKAEVNYISDTTLHWKTTDNKGVVAEGDEKVSYEKLTDNLHFLNWIEKDGYTVSQVIDTKNGTVKAFWSFADDKSTRGKRGSTFVDAKFKFVR